jgi:hypothetical protein
VKTKDMTPPDLLAFLLRVLAVVDDHEQRGDLYWRTDEHYAPVTFWVDCSDVFAWGGSDCEHVGPQNVGELERAYADAKAACEHGEFYAAHLFAARMRKMRPQGAAYPPNDYKGLWPLFDACGPRRETGLGNPRPAPTDPPSPGASP